MDKFEMFFSSFTLNVLVFMMQNRSIIRSLRKAQNKKKNFFYFQLKQETASQLKQN